MDQRPTLPTIWSAPPPASGVDKSAFIGRKPNKVIPVPGEYRRQVLSRERELLINDIKDKTDCDVFAHWVQGKITSFDVYGSGHGVEKAVHYLNHWICNAHTKSTGASAWAKLPAYDFNEWYYKQVEEMDNAYKQRFRGPVPSINDEDTPTHAVRLEGCRKTTTLIQ
jgi:acyl-homoserine lactone acylase PvdQ